MDQLNIPELALDGWRAAVERLRVLLLSALAGTRAGNSTVAERRLERAHQEIVHLAARLNGEQMRLEALPRPRDTPANRLYAAKLREAWLAGLAVDRERYGEDIGTDGPAMVIELILRDVEEELRQ